MTTEYEEQVIALVQHLDINPDEVTETSWGDYEAEGAEYMVLTDAEADDKWEDYLDSYLEDWIYPELPDNLVVYFDGEAWKRDARYDGRGHVLSSYDGTEYEELVNDTWYYIYRTD